MLLRYLRPFSALAASMYAFGSTALPSSFAYYGARAWPEVVSL